MLANARRDALAMASYELGDDPGRSAAAPSPSAGTG
jgi:hypothetical protein